MHKKSVFWLTFFSLILNLFLTIFFLALNDSIFAKCSRLKMNFNVMSRETGLARLINNLSKPVVLPRKIVSLNTFKIHHLGFFVPIKNGLNIGLNIAFKRGISWTFLFETKIFVWPLQWPLFKSLCLFLPIFSKILSKLSCLKMILISLF